MFLGEFLCLLVFKFVWFSTARYRIERMTYRGDASSPIVRHWPIRIAKETRLVEGEQNFNPFIFWIPAICDMLSTCLSYVALNYTSASSFQMLRGSVMVFTALLRFFIEIEIERTNDEFSFSQRFISSKEIVGLSLVGHRHRCFWFGRSRRLRHRLLQNA